MAIFKLPFAEHCPIHNIMEVRRERVMNPIEITPDEDLIPPERLAKGDLEVAINGKGFIHRAVPARLTIAKELIRRRIFPYHYEIYGVGFLELQNAFRSPWGVRSSAVLLEQWGVGVSNSKADSIYQHVCRQVGIAKIEVIQYVLEAVERRGKDKIVGPERRKNRINDYKQCFDKLLTVMDEERERIEIEKRGNGQGS